MKMSELAEENSADNKSGIKEKIKFECSECSLPFKTSKLLKIHTKAEHFREDAFLCPMCPKTFREFCHLGNHIRMAHNDDTAVPFTQEFPCSECPEIFPESEELKNHMKETHNREDAFQCSGCPRTFKKLTHMNIHIRASHQEEIEIHMKKENKFPCALCSEKFAESKTLKSHVLITHNREDAFNCTSCSKTFKELNALNKHIKYLHTFKEEKGYSCHLCSKQFQISCNLNRHIKDIHEKEQNYLCQECPKKFSQRSTLERHMVKVHAKEGDFKCDQCTSSFPFASSLDTHKRGVHDGERKFLCHNCSKGFLYKTQLSKHLEDKACGITRGGSRYRKKPGYIPRIPIPTGDNPLDCPICSKHFTFPNNLQRHVREVHEKEQNFFCPDCPLKFSQRATLERHRVSVHKLEGQHKCDQCPISFAYGYELDTHVTSVHFGQKKRRKSGKRKLETGQEMKSSESFVSSFMETKFVPNNPASPERVMANVVPKKEAAEMVQVYMEDESSEDSFMETVEVSLTDITLSEMDENLKYRIYCTFKDHERSEIVSLISKGVLNPADLISIVVNSDKANLKPVELIIAIIDIFQP